MKILTLLWQYRKAAAYILLAVIAVWSLIAYRHSLISDGKAAGEASVRAEWQVERDVVKAAADAQIKANELSDAADAARNEDIAHAHAKELAAATADRDRYLRLLTRAREAGSGTGPAPEAAGIAGTAPASTPGSTESPGTVAEYAAAVNSAIADVIVEAKQNASQLDSLIAEVKPQMGGAK